ncbi:MAG: DUF4856 domain-containing protein [Bacteroidota bacterium]|nr:DUF4856 domain-containing protein [Bacteroidota bacterium]
MIKYSKVLALIMFACAISLNSCIREGCDDPNAINFDKKAKKSDGSCVYATTTYTIPTTYDFANVNYSGQLERLGMLDELVTEMKKSNTQGTALSALKLKEMYSNTGGHFSFTSTKQLKDKTFVDDRILFEDYMDKLAAASSSTTPGSNGIAGVVTSSTDGSKKYLFDENGIEYLQLIEKGLMGAITYYQATSVYLSEDKIGAAVDNTTVVTGEGTKMEHHWDEAFGYFGVPRDFPTNLTGIRYYGKYCDSRNAKLNSNKALMDAFIKGRAAISHKDMEVKDQMIKVIGEEWEKVIAATAISYLNKAKSNFADDALRNHELSEALAFIKALKYNTNRKISITQIDTAVNTLGSNFYNIAQQSIESARDQLSTIYGFDSIKTSL